MHLRPGLVSDDSTGSADTLKLIRVLTAKGCTNGTSDAEAGVFGGGFNKFNDDTCFPDTLMFPSPLLIPLLATCFSTSGFTSGTRVADAGLFGGGFKANKVAAFASNGSFAPPILRLTATSLFPPRIPRV